MTARAREKTVPPTVSTKEISTILMAALGDAKARPSYLNVYCRDAPAYPTDSFATKIAIVAPTNVNPDQVSIISVIASPKETIARAQHLHI
jgi:hypothetical protein